MTLVAHQKQFVLGPLPVAVRPDWLTIRISDDLVLSYCPKLRVRQLQSKDGMPHWLLGVAVRADEPMSSISDGFQQKNSAEIENWTGLWAGRWFLISANRCWQDASGCLGTYHRRVRDCVWISSSPALLGDRLPGAPPASRLRWRVTDNKGIDWVPLPFSTREGVYKLLPLRTIEPQTGRTTPVRFAAPITNAGEELPALVSTLKTIITNWAQADFRERHVALTAGIDSRTILAAAVAAKVEVKTFTTRFPITVRRDMVLPPRIARSVRVPHTLRRLPPVGATEVDPRMAAIAEHMDGTGWHRSTMHMARCKYDLLSDREQTVAHGNAFGDARCYFWAKFSNVGLEAQPTDPDHILDAFTFRSSWRPEPLALWRRAFQGWIDSLSDPVPLALDWRDRFYWEQRLGGWNSITQGFWDMLDGSTFYPGNCLWVSDLFLRFSPEERKEGFPQREAIRLLAPELLKVPINPKPIGRRLRETVRDLLGPKVIYAVRSLMRDPYVRRAP
jgi:hypothetical protein